MDIDVKTLFQILGAACFIAAAAIACVIAVQPRAESDDEEVAGDAHPFPLAATSTRVAVLPADQVGLGNPDLPNSQAVVSLATGELIALA